LTTAGKVRLAADSFNKEALVKIKLAQYGVSHAHAAGKARVMKESSKVEFCGVFEPSAEIRNTLGKDPAYEGVRWFSNKAEFLEDETIVGAAIEGRVAENLAFAREAIEHSKHIWLDKPAGDDLEEFRAILNMAREKRLLVQLGYMFRYNAGFQFILDWAKSGRLGDIFSVRGRMSTHVDEEGRRRLAAHDGGILFELLCHLIDFVVTLLGRPDKVTSFLRNDLGAVPKFRDNTAAVFEYPNAMAILESTAMEISPFPARRVEVYGTRGSAILEPLEPPALRLCLDENRDGYKKGWQTVPVENRPRYVESLRAFVADIRGEKRPDRSLDHEFTVQETVLRAAQIIG
jgi:predicted dehydrogenase